MIHQDKHEKDHPEGDAPEKGSSSGVIWSVAIGSVVLVALGGGYFMLKDRGTRQSSPGSGPEGSSAESTGGGSGSNASNATAAGESHDSHGGSGAHTDLTDHGEGGTSWLPYIGGGLVGTGGLAWGGKWLYDRYVVDPAGSKPAGGSKTGQNQNAAAQGKASRSRGIMSWVVPDPDASLTDQVKSWAGLAIGVGVLGYVAKNYLLNPNSTTGGGVRPGQHGGQGHKPGHGPNKPTGTVPKPHAVPQENPEVGEIWYNKYAWGKKNPLLIETVDGETVPKEKRRLTYTGLRHGSKGESGIPKAGLGGWVGHNSNLRPGTRVTWKDKNNKKVEGFIAPSKKTDGQLNHIAPEIIRAQGVNCNDFCWIIKVYESVGGVPTPTKIRFPYIFMLDRISQTEPVYAKWATVKFATEKMPTVPAKIPGHNKSVQPGSLHPFMWGEWQVVSPLCAIPVEHNGKLHGYRIKLRSLVGGKNDKARYKEPLMEFYWAEPNFSGKALTKPTGTVRTTFTPVAAGSPTRSISDAMGSGNGMLMMLAGLATVLLLAAVWCCFCKKQAPAQDQRDPAQE